MFNSFVEAIITAIDARSPYNANHTKNIVKNVQRFVEYLNKNHSESYGYFDTEKTKELVMAAWLHDIGKLGIPLNIMDKSSKLGDKYELVINRLDMIEAKLKLDIYEKRDKNKEEIEKEIKDIKTTKKLVIEINDSPKLIEKEKIQEIERLHQKTYIDSSGIVKNWIEKDELECLKIEKGTLNKEERKIIQSHINIGEDMLEHIEFTSNLSNAPKWAFMHHEFLDGSGYPNGCKGKDVPVEARILTILDIFDSLTSQDRPYRKAMKIEKAVEVLVAMGKEGKLDLDLIRLFLESKILQNCREVKKDE